MTGAPLSGATLAFAALTQTVTSGGDGIWTLTGTTGAGVTLPVAVSAPGYVTRDTAIRWELAGRRGIAVDLIPERPPFSMSFFKQLVRNGFETPSELRPLLRWTTTPNFYINTFNPRTGQALEPAEVDLVVVAIREAVPQLTGGVYAAGAIETGNGEQPARPNFINVKFVYEPAGEYCGRAFVGANPGEITINYDRCASACGSLKVTPKTIAHEVGHALGFWHTTGTGIMTGQWSTTCDRIRFSDAELLHARLAYQRPRGNVDPDRDPSSFSAVETHTAPLVTCGLRDTLGPS